MRSRVENVGSRGFDGGVDVGAWSSVCVDVNGVSAPGLAYGLAVLRGAVADEDLLRSADLALVPAERVLLDPPQHLQEAALDDLVGNEAGELGGLGTAPR